MIVAAGLARSARAALLRWYRGSRRDLPWRRTRDPYAIWISEIMLQQTRVAAVLPYYERFLDRFPDPSALAAADEEEVLATWSGLGYYRRARALHAAAHVIVERHAGRLPQEPALLRELPGIGRYTAGAIASIAFDVAEPIVDGNIRRVLSRLREIDGERLGRAPAERRIWEIATTLVRGPQPGELNQALMELGALICLPRRPLCDACPLADACLARKAGSAERLPTAVAPVPPVDLRVGVAVVVRDRKVLLERPGATSPLRGSWDLPAFELRPTEEGGVRTRQMLEHLRGFDLSGGEPIGRANHAIMNRRLRLEIFRYRLRQGRVSRKLDLRWERPAELDRVAVSGATRKVLRRAGELT